MKVSGQRTHTEVIALACVLPSINYTGLIPLAMAIKTILPVQGTCGKHTRCKEMSAITFATGFSLPIRASDVTGIERDARHYHRRCTKIYAPVQLAVLWPETKIRATTVARTAG